MAAITLIDYGLGNIHAFANIYRRANIDVEIANTPNQLEKAEKLILPGVGAFDWAMERLDRSGFRDELDNAVLGRKVPVLGVCVGMQMMARSSTEGKLPGLGWIDAEVRRFNEISNHTMPLPHMGWNDIHAISSDCLFKNMEDPRFYHLHSYCVIPAKAEHVLARAEYGVTFTAAVRNENVFGTQFHPEKSHQWGIDLLRNFAEL